jgi:hypothetical protein
MKQRGDSAATVAFGRGPAAVIKIAFVPALTPSHCPNDGLPLNTAHLIPASFHVGKKFPREFSKLPRVSSLQSLPAKIKSLFPRVKAYSNYIFQYLTKMAYTLLPTLATSNTVSITKEETK